MTTRDNTKPQNGSAQRAYQKPRLMKYGVIEDLTAGGSGKASEGNKGEGKARP